MADTTCRYCKAAMPEGARYCAACEHHQGRWAQFWAQLKIQDLMGLISVGALAVTSVVGGTLNANAFNPHPVINASLLACREDSVDFAVSNTGNRTAFIRTGAASLYFHDEPAPAQRRWLVADRALLLKSGETAPLTFKITPALAPYGTEADRLDCKLRLTFNWVEPGAGDKPVNASCACPEVTTE